MKKIYYLICILSLYSCGMKTRLDKSNDSMDRTNKSVEKTNDSLKKTEIVVNKTNNSIEQISKELKELKGTLDTTNAVLLDLVVPLNLLVKSTSNLIDQMKDVNGQLSLIKNDLGSLISHLAELNAVMDAVKKYGDDPRFKKLLDKILDEDNGLAHLMDQSLSFFKKVNDCVVPVFKWEYLSPDMENLPSGPFYNYSIDDFVVINSEFNDKSYFKIPSDIIGTVNVGHKELITRSGSRCQEISQSLRTNIDRMVSQFLQMVDEIIAKNPDEPPKKKRPE